MRAFVCWLFALFFLQFDESGHYDIRFQLRGDQRVDRSIVLVTLKASELIRLDDLKTGSLISANELADMSDSFFWDRQLWQSLLAKILHQQPHKVAVTLYFGSNVGQIRLTPSEVQIFRDPRLIWAANSSGPEKLSLPMATRPDRSNIAHIEILKDNDGVVRRLAKTMDGLPDLASRVTGSAQTGTNRKADIINYKGRQLFTEVTLSDVLSPDLPADFFKNKIILIGTEKTNSSQIQTPIGPMTRHEFWATVTENKLNGSFIKKFSGFIYALFLLALTGLAILIISSYPQSVALFLMIWVATLTAAFSAWVFDSFSLWIPVATPLSLFILIWVLFIGYQALKIEQAHARLKQQQSYLSELEQLKNNFVSLISHDLKTPIAKIQAVLDRVLTQNQLSPELQTDLSSLKEYSEELNRYIQSILKVLRVESRDFKILKETADINGIIENVAARLQPLAQSKKIDLQLNLEPMFLIEIDVTLMTEVFLNIIENAIKYTPGHGRVSVRSFETETDVYVEVSDSGEGIDPEDQELIWQKFVRGRAQDYKTKGTGLGLYLVKYFIELHGGRISMNSELKKGTTFIVQLPIEQTEAEKSPL